MPRTLLSVLTAVALLVTVAPSAPAATTASAAEAGTHVTGTWRGSVYGDDGATAGYGARVRIFTRDGRLHGRIASDGCFGAWRYQGRGNGWIRFTEVITRDTTGGTCVERVAVKVRRDDERLRVVWREPRTGDTATMLARAV